MSVGIEKGDFRTILMKDVYENMKNRISSMNIVSNSSVMSLLDEK
jgi:hypothetical protein